MHANADKTTRKGTQVHAQRYTHTRTHTHTHAHAHAHTHTHAPHVRPAVHGPRAILSRNSGAWAATLRCKSAALPAVNDVAPQCNSGPGLPRQEGVLPSVLQVPLFRCPRRGARVRDFCTARVATWVGYSAHARTTYPHTHTHTHAQTPTHTHAQDTCPPSVPQSTCISVTELGCLGSQ